MRRRSLTSLILGLALLPLLLAGPPDRADAQQPRRGGTLVMLVQPEPPTLASYLSTSGPIGQVTAKVYDGLLEYDFNLNPQPSLAESWQLSPDNKTITFKLRRGVRFHDGKPFTSADVKFSVMEVLKKVHPRGPNTFRALTDIETPDEATAVFKFDAPAPYVLRALSGYESPMLPKHLFEGADPKSAPNANKPVGTGPFKFVEWDKGQFIRLDRNEQYWKPGRPYLDRIVARFIPDPSTRSAAMEKGEVHFASFDAIPFVDVNRLKALPHIAVSLEGYSMINPITLLEINSRRPPLDKREVRQAIAYALDRKFIIDNIWFGFGRPGTGPMNANFAKTGLYTNEVRRYEVPDRVQRANALLDGAGLKRGADGMRFKITHDILPYGEQWQRLGEYIKQALGQIGIDVTLRHEDVPSWLKRIFTNYDFDLTSDFYYNLADPVLGVHRQYLTDQIRQGTVFVNSTNYSNPKVDELLKQATTEANHAKRAALYKEFQKIVVEDSPIVWLFDMQFVNMYNNRFQDVVTSPLGVYASFDRAWMKP
ncbi:MAG TPA: ABC transporter substrate-binding protein [Methylomirabilota bacterium]|nr:ABC transporter substrate-binding protein [Methylomirabilota bacterium]